MIDVCRQAGHTIFLQTEALADSGRDHRDLPSVSRIKPSREKRWLCKLHRDRGCQERPNHSNAATSVTVVSSTSVTATTPAHSAGAVTVTVTNSNSLSGSLANGFTYRAPISFLEVAAATPQTSIQVVSVTFPGTQTAGNLKLSR